MKNIIIILLTAIIYYFIIAFIKAEINSFNWSLVDRAMYVLTLLPILFLVFVFLKKIDA
jgi:hypothetical protein